MNSSLRKELSKLDQQPQRHDGVLDQMADLYSFAHRMGMFEAASLIRSMTDKDGPAQQGAFPPRIMELLSEVTDRKGTETRGPWEDGNGQPLQDDAEAAIAWIFAR